MTLYDIKAGRWRGNTIHRSRVDRAWELPPCVWVAKEGRKTVRWLEVFHAHLPLLYQHPLVPSALTRELCNMNKCLKYFYCGKTQAKIIRSVYRFPAHLVHRFNVLPFLLHLCCPNCLPLTAYCFYYCFLCSFTLGGQVKFTYMEMQIQSPLSPFPLLAAAFALGSLGNPPCL